MLKALSENFIKEMVNIRKDIELILKNQSEIDYTITEMKKH